MKTSPYSLRSFIDLAEHESRQGKSLSRIVPNVQTAVQDLQELRKSYWEKIRYIDEDSNERALARTTYVEERNALRLARDAILEGALQDSLARFQHALVSESFTWDLTEGKRIGQRQTYQISHKLETSFPAKQASAVMRNVSGTLMASRNSIVRALKQSLAKNYMHAIYRFDIKSFFASIPHESLIGMIDDVRSLDPITVTLVKQLLQEYATLTGGNIGVPQGVGLSSQLAEFYLRNFDRVMRSFPGVLFYARYVDDIIFVIKDEETLKSAVLRSGHLLAELGLEINHSEGKFSHIVTSKTGDYPDNEALEYLGYQFRRVDGQLVTSLTKKRFERRVKRLNDAFDHWLLKDPIRKTANSGDEGLLVDRVRFLAGNTALLNSKNNVAIGIYFSNSSLDRGAKELKDLDRNLQSLVTMHKTRMSNETREKLRKISFEKSFNERTFIRFKQKRIEQIKMCWQEVES